MPFPTWPFNILPFFRSSEIAAAKHLRTLGFQILASPYRTRLGEIDIVARDGPTLVFVEVKALRSSVPPESAVNHPKRQRIRRAASSYISQYNLHESPIRFDILAVTHAPGQKPVYRLLKDAFENTEFDL